MRVGLDWRISEKIAPERRVYHLRADAFVLESRFSKKEKNPVFAYPLSLINMMTVTNLVRLLEPCSGCIQNDDMQHKRRIK
jgi:hypothetical protein